MKILEDKYPMGSLPYQKSPGRFIDPTLYENLSILAKAIVRDMTWLGIVSSSTLEVGTGKSTFVQQLAEAYLDLVNKQHGMNLELTMNNILWKPRDLIKRAFKVPKYSVIIVDEWEDSHYWSELGISLRQFFRKCRQLNLFILIIIPNFFQLPANYAISRSVFFIDVKFEGEFERGFFSFYNFNKKKELYVKGKKTQDYGVVYPNFSGRFTEGYVVDEKEYRKAKLKDLEQEGSEQTQMLSEKQMKALLYNQIYESLGDVTVERLAKAFGVAERTANRWNIEAKRLKIRETDENEPDGDNYINNYEKIDNIDDDKVVGITNKEQKDVVSEP